MAPRMLGQETSSTQPEPRAADDLAVVSWITGIPWQVAVQEHGTSASTFAFDLQPGGVVERVPVGATLPATTIGSGAPTLALSISCARMTCLRRRRRGGPRSMSCFRAEVRCFSVRPGATHDGLRERRNDALLDRGTAEGRQPTHRRRSRFGQPRIRRIPPPWQRPPTSSPTRMGRGLPEDRPPFRGSTRSPRVLCGDNAHRGWRAPRDLHRTDVVLGGPIAITAQDLWSIIGTMGGSPNYTVRRFALPAW